MMHYDIKKIVNKAIFQHRKKKVRINGSFVSNQWNQEDLEFKERVWLGIIPLLAGGLKTALFLLVIIPRTTNIKKGQHYE